MRDCPWILGFSCLQTLSDQDGKETTFHSPETLDLLILFPGALTQRLKTISKSQASCLRFL